MRTVSPRSAASSTHGATPPSWSSSVVRISSPAAKSRPAARVSAKFSVVMFIPKAISAGVAPRNRAASAFDPSRIASTARPVAYGAPRFPEASRIAAAIASPTSSGPGFPPGASRNAKPERSAEKRARAVSTSNVVAAIRASPRPGSARTRGSMFPPETTHTTFPVPAFPASAAAVASAPAPSAITRARSAISRMAAAASLSGTVNASSISACACTQTASINERLPAPSTKDRV